MACINDVTGLFQVCVLPRQDLAAEAAPQDVGRTWRQAAAPQRQLSRRRHPDSCCSCRHWRVIVVDSCDAAVGLQLLVQQDDDVVDESLLCVRLDL